MSQPNSVRAHDAFFKHLFSDLRRVREYFEVYLPTELSSRVEWESLQREDGTFVDDTLKSSYTDLVFSVRLKDLTSVYLCLLLEHKSHPDKNTPFQLLYYISGALWREVQNGQTPRLVVPVVFYHGEETWEYKPIEQHFGHLPEDILRYLPKFEWIFHNLQKNPDEQILTAFRNHLLISALLTLKHSFDEGYLQNQAVFLLESAVDEDGNYFKALFVYFFNRIKNEKNMTKVLEQLSNEVQAEAMSVLDLYEKRGMQKESKKANK
jgi:predicted transposase/invertase (TIGR01784 family)